jgi:hypothetical protein
VVDSLVKRRCVISIEDYEPVDVAQQYANFNKGLQRFSQTWNVATKISPLRMEADGAVAVWNIETEAHNWKVTTEFRLLNWSDTIRKEFRHWSFYRAWRAIKAIFDFVISGTCWRYFRLNWRFGLLFLYPVLATLSFLVIAYLFSGMLRYFEVPYALFLSCVIAAALFSAFIEWFDHIIFPRVVDIWIVLHELVYLERTNLAERLSVFSRDIIAKFESNDFDEIVIVGHGIGAVLQPVIVDRAFWALPEFGKDGRSVSLLSLGSLLLAVGLHPEASWVVGPVSRIARDRWVYWAEYQAKQDVMSFPGSNPVTELIGEHGKPVLQDISFKDMIVTDTKRQFPQIVFGNHRQFVRANSKRYFYDFFMVCCGPFTLSMRVEHPELMVKVFYPDGRLIID